MAIDQKTMLQAIYDAMFDALSTPPTGLGNGQPIVPRATTYLSLCMPGNPVDASQFANAWSPTNPDGSEYASENFSNLVDEEPVMSPLYGASGNSIDQLYGEIVKANVAPPPPDPAGEAAYKKARDLLYVDGTDYNDQGRPVTVKVPSPLYQNYQRKKKAYEDALTSYLANYNQYDLSKPADQRKWAILAPVVQGPVDTAYQDFQTAAPGVVQTALNTIGQYQQSSLANIFSQARQTYDSTRLGSLVQPGLFWHRCDPFPANWFTDSAAVNFTQLTLTSQRVRLSEDSRFSSFSAGGGVNFGLWRVGASASHTSQQYDMSSDTSNMTVSFRFGRIEIHRRWLNAALLSLRGWSTAGRSPGGYSNGNGTSNPGVFPLLPTAFLVARDIKISASWGHADLHTASQSTSASASVGWGPFSLSGSYSNSSSSRRFNSSFDGTTLTVPGIQIVGWLSAINPFCPPTGGPPAAPEEAGRDRPAAQRRHPYSDRYLPAAAPTAESLEAMGILGAAPMPIGDGASLGRVGLGAAPMPANGSSERKARIPSEPAEAPMQTPQLVTTSAEMD